MRIKKRELTGVAYTQDQDLFTAPTPDDPEVVALARGDDVRGLLAGQLPFNGEDLRDVILARAFAFRAAR